jgi:hypothetical protein
LLLDTLEISTYIAIMEAEPKRKRERWCETCMLPIRDKDINWARNWRMQAEQSKDMTANPIWKTLGLCAYCKKAEATHSIHPNNLLYNYMKLREFCSEQCLQGAILEAIFNHNLTDKRFLSLITKD